MKKIIGSCFVFFMILSTPSFAQTGSVNISENPLIKELMTLNVKMTKANQIGHRYKIQLGSYNSISQAKAIEQQFKDQHSNLPIRIEYESPNYKVWVGDYVNRIEADRLFLKIKQEYRSAFVFQPNK